MAQVLVIDGNHVKRLMQLCRTIDKGRRCTVEQLQKKLKTSRRTLFRDLNNLEKMGVKLDLSGKGYNVRQSAAVCKKLLVDWHTKEFNTFLESCLK